MLRKASRLSRQHTGVMYHLHRYDGTTLVWRNVLVWALSLAGQLERKQSCAAVRACAHKI